MARKLTGLAEARRIVVESCARFPSEQVPLEQGLGRALADGDLHGLPTGESVELRAKLLSPKDVESVEGLKAR